MAAVQLETKYHPAVLWTIEQPSDGVGETGDGAGEAANYVV